MRTLIAKLANNYDALGQIKKADRLDGFLTRKAQQDIEPTAEDLWEEEEWLKDEFSPISEEDLQAEDEWLKDDPLDGLEGEDRDVAKLYLEGVDPQDIQAELRRIKEDQQKILEQLSQLLMDKQTTPDMLSSQMPITPEASLMREFSKLADMLDSKKMFKQADKVERIMHKLAQGLPPDDEDFEFVDEPTDADLEILEKEGGNYPHLFLQIIQTLAEGGYASLEAAQEEAAEALNLYDDSIEFDDESTLFDDLPGTEDEDDILKPSGEDKSFPDNVITFPK